MNAVLLGALIHDLGKVGQRAGLSGNCNEIASSILSPLLPHAIEKPIKLTSITEASTILNSPGNKSIKTLILSDWIATGKIDENENAKTSAPLLSVFSHVDIGKGCLSGSAYYFPNSLCIARETIFPVDDVQGIEEAYKKSWRSLIDDFSTAQRMDDPEAYLTTVFYLLKRHTWAVPFSNAPDRRDISLYDHSRIVCAIAACLMNEDIDEVSQELLSAIPGNERFLLVAGDVSGIQDFLYTITSKGAVKGLRGRSLYLQLLSEAAAKFMLRELGYPLSNLIYSGGGHFYLLISSSDEKRLEDLKLILERAILQMHQGDIFLALGWEKMAACDLMGTSEEAQSGLSSQWGKAMNSAGISKLRRFSLLGSEAYEEIFGLNPREKGGLAPVCDVCKREGHLWSRIEGGWVQWDPSSDEAAFCDQCNSFEKMGERLSQAEYLIEVQGGWKDKSSDDQLLCSFKPFGIEYYACQDKEALQALMKNFHESRSIIYSLGPEDSINESLAQIAYENHAALGFRLIAKSTPMTKNGTIADLKELARLSRGVPRIGILRIDVDNLGLVFSKGLGKNASLSRISALSTMLSIFFDGWLDKICQDWANQVYLIYSGGDDLFLIGSWNVIPEIALCIRNDFRDYTCSNPNFSLSGGITLAEEKYPLYKSAKSAKKALDNAKTRDRDGMQKDAISFLNETLDWTEMKISNDIAFSLESWMKVERDGKTLPRSVLWNLYAAWDLYWKNRAILGKELLSQKDVERLALQDRWRWRMIYFLDRAGGRSKAFKEDLATLKTAILENKWKGTVSQRDLIEYLGVSARWAELLTREVSVGEQATKEASIEEGNHESERKKGY
jgi:CRISPR-associated protein Csm1